MKKIILLLTFAIFLVANSFSQETYKIGKTEYYYDQFYSTTGKPMVKRSEANKNEFLKSIGYEKLPEGYEVDHIIPLSEGGTDDPSNMQLLTIKQHNIKTANERSKYSNSTYDSYPKYNSNSTNRSSNFHSSPTITSDKIIYTGPKGGQYYINSRGNKTYLKK
jgi:hypothetical protein